MNENDPTVSHGSGFSGAIDGEKIREENDEEIIQNVTSEEIQEDLKSIEEMRVETVAPKRKGLRHQPSMYAAKKRKHKLALQRAARKRQRSK